MPKFLYVFFIIFDLAMIGLEFILNDVDVLSIFCFGISALALSVTLILGGGK